MLVALSLSTSLLASGPPSLHAHRTSVAPELDGRLDEATWDKAEASDHFTQKTPNEGQSPSEHTTLRIMYDDDAIYVGFECVQRTVPITLRLTRRDAEATSDWVSIALGTRADGRSAFDFSVSVGGVLGDGVRFNDTEYSAAWDENWQGNAALTAHGWSAELRIPLRILRFRAAREQSWDLQARRHISALQETEEWSPIPRRSGGEVSHYGKLYGLVGLGSPTSLELRQFVLGQLRRLSTGNAAEPASVDTRLSAGVDLKYHVSQELTLDATFNPDFAQIEADQQVLNLANVELYLPEKRPFFLEGLDLFETPRQLVYTRRIGSTPLVPPALGQPAFGERIVEVPNPAVIYAASKLTGKLSEHWSVATLQALVGQNELRLAMPDGRRARRVTDPLTAFNVLSVRHELEQNGHVGATFTATERLEPRDGQALVAPGPNNASGATQKLCANGALVTPAMRCFNAAYVAGLDWRWRSPGGDWATLGQLTSSLSSGGPVRETPDGTRITPGQLGSGAFVGVAREGGDHVIGDANFEYAGRRLDYNDLGYSERSNQYAWNAKLEYRELDKRGSLLESHVYLAYWGATTISGLPLESGYELGTLGKLDSFWQYLLLVNYLPPRFDDREVGDGTALQRARRAGVAGSLSSNPNLPVSIELTTEYRWIRTGLELNAEGRLVMRPLPGLSLELIPRFSYTSGEPRYAADGAEPGQQVFGRLEARSASTELRVSYTFLPQLTLQAYSQLFVAAGHYADLLAFTTAPGSPPAAIHLNQLRPYALALGENPDFEQGAVNVNLVLFWEYATGSTFSLVYARSQDPEASLAPERRADLDFEAFQRAPAVDAFLFKLSSWWGG